jgi:hypothetical protein
MMDWIKDDSVFSKIINIKDDFVEYSIIFNENFDEDYDCEKSGVSFEKYLTIYNDFILSILDFYSIELNNEQFENLKKLLFLLSLASRRMFVDEDSYENIFFDNPKLFEKINQIFKNDIRILQQDEWMFLDLEPLSEILSKSMKLGLRVFLDTFIDDEFDSSNIDLIGLLKNYDENIVIAHETDPVWRSSILNNYPNLFTVRRVETTDGENKNLKIDYAVLILKLKRSNWTCYKINKESVRSLWSSQQNELIFVGNEDSERGSIQQLPLCLRNIINQCSDVPIGYPVYVSELTTSYF